MENKECTLFVKIPQATTIFDQKVQRIKDIQRKKKKKRPVQNDGFFYGWDFFIRSNFLRLYKMTEKSLILLASIGFDFFGIFFHCLGLRILANHNGKFGCFGYGNFDAIFSYNLIVN